MSEHTAGWSVEFQELGGYDCMTAAYYIKAADGSRIAELDLRDYGQDNNVSYDVAAPRALPNARLIAAAPETTEELENLVSWIEESFPREEDQPDLTAARAAIAKARGEQS